LPKDKLIVVACISWTRWRLVYEFLRNKGLIVRYLEDWVMWWVWSGWDYKWEHIFWNVYNDVRYNLLFTNKQLDKKLENSNIRLIDSREPYRINNNNKIESAIELSVMYTPSTLTEKAFSRFKEWDEFIIICDDWVNCFDAKLVWIKLEEKWAILHGFFNNPSYFYKK
jgi:hypothetical protein